MDCGDVALEAHRNLHGTRATRPQFTDGLDVLVGELRVRCMLTCEAACFVNRVLQFHNSAVSWSTLLGLATYLMASVFWGSVVT